MFSLTLRARKAWHTLCFCKKSLDTLVNCVVNTLTRQTPQCGLCVHIPFTLTQNGIQARAHPSRCARARMRSLCVVRCGKAHTLHCGGGLRVFVRLCRVCSARAHSVYHAHSNVCVKCAVRTRAMHSWHVHIISQHIPHSNCPWGVALFGSAVRVHF